MYRFVQDGLRILGSFPKSGGGQDEVAQLLRSRRKNRRSSHAQRRRFWPSLSHDFFLESAAIAQKVNAPVKLTWTREAISSTIIIVPAASFYERRNRRQRKDCRLA